MAIVVKSMATSGVDGFMVEIEASTIKGHQQIMSIIGLPDQAIKEAGERIQAAIESCGYDFPKEKSIISLAPGDKKKRGSHFDLGMIIALLYQTDQISPKNLSDYAFIGELALDGRIRPCNGVLSMVTEAKKCGVRSVVVPFENRQEAASVSDINVCPVKSLHDTIKFLEGKLDLSKQDDEDGEVFSEEDNQTGDKGTFSDPKDGFKDDIDFPDGYTVAVLGNGVDICYPREHDKLYEEIAESGCILSEYPLGTVPREYYFPLRNRLIAALSDWLYVIEAGRHSGTVSTVESGEKYGREVKMELICSS